MAKSVKIQVTDVVAFEKMGELLGRRMRIHHVAVLDAFELVRRGDDGTENQCK